MLLRSSSTPVLGSLLSSFSDSPNNSFDSNKTPSDHLKKISFSHSTHSNFHSFICNSSPISHSFASTPDFIPESGVSTKGFRRAHSDGNLAGLSANDDDFHNSVPSKLPRRPSPVLQTIPSFTVYDSRGNEYDEEEEEEEEEVGGLEGLPRSVTIGENIMSIGGDFNFANEKGMGLVGLEEENEEGVFDTGAEAPPLFLARGLGIDAGNPSDFMTGCRSGFQFADSSRGGDGSDVENHYKRMVEEDPCNPLFLRNYAQFLYQSKGDFARAEEYYSRAVLAGPGDGELLSQYAKLIWERHHDQERASSYFEQAVQSAPEDSHVLAAYASFLWETEDEEEENSRSSNYQGIPVFHGAVASASA
ncbi:uncharacterized protein LOC131240588 [Magnolia sinica]|uniref:uncharacterized protein LOC131240588 n=1 Tax=Magnolia sinica TaxID=86752 RepID=UPI002657DD0E|nr:uncharacterized protein LOC131240588 [Magnolia sinica]XP_058094870.1 uncharacterized protein LOC131240588 [Magnolia sinica]